MVKEEEMMLALGEGARGQKRTAELNVDIKINLNDSLHDVHTVANFHLRAEHIDGKKMNRNCSEKYSDKDKERLSVSLPH